MGVQGLNFYYNAKKPKQILFRLTAYKIIIILYFIPVPNRSVRLSAK